MRIVVFGAGVQGTLFAVRLSLSGHDVSLVARGSRAAELARGGAAIEDIRSGRLWRADLPVSEKLEPDCAAELCLVTVRREQLESVLPIFAATQIPRFVFLVNHANGSEFLYEALGRKRVVSAFPGFSGGIENNVDRFVEIAEQPTTVEASAPDIVALFRAAGIRVRSIRDMDAWLRRHAVFIAAMSGALCAADCDAGRLAHDRDAVKAFILAVREGWRELDRKQIGPAPIPLRAIFEWSPLFIGTAYWSRLLASRGDDYFARHVRRAAPEMEALGADVLSLMEQAPIPNLRRLYKALSLVAQSENDGWRMRLPRG
jgi:2-dehydropantoate 2-reductase